MSASTQLHADNTVRRSPLDPEGVVRLLGRVLHGLPRLPDAACIGHGEVFDPDDGDTEAAQAICASCPVLTECQQWAAPLRGRQRPAGVIAGQINPRPIGRPTNREESPA